MTVQYVDQLSRNSEWANFKLLIKWRGSVYKTVWRNMLVYLLLYLIISFVYRFALPDCHRRIFEKVVLRLSSFGSVIPISFVLGFYVGLVVNRWLDIFRNMPWPDNAAILASTNVHGTSEEARTIRVTALRYVNLSIAITFATICPAVKETLNTAEDLLREGYIIEKEINTIKKLEEQTDQHKAWLPSMWACKILAQAREGGHIESDLALKAIVAEILGIRVKCGTLLGYYGNNIPLNYTQFLDPNMGYPGHTLDYYVPVFGLLELFFYIGWLNVADSLLDPFGEEDHDFELFKFLERNVKMTELLCDVMPSDLPPGVGEQESQGDEKQESSLLTDILPYDLPITADQPDTPLYDEDDLDATSIDSSKPPESWYY
ncbi:bestrophin-3 isoform X2 [Procambarus clarkii]|uniref:bestrophin-3 isoform X2 n=1 Tax=Procambarus clarkii TaxID=6728 RepID=UPI00374343E6